MTTKRCPVCGHMPLTAMKGAYRFEPPAIVPGGPIVIADTEWSHCGSCGDDVLSPNLEASIDEERRRRLGLLTRGEIRNVRETLRLSVQDMSQLLGVGEQTYDRWENGRSLPTMPGNALLRQMAKSPETLPSLAAVRTTNQK
jgi:putative zinc finger/helix-turn-helix YgiT family protein